jgi:NitT/TauT family transport system substrate-binding protein
VENGLFVKHGLTVEATEFQSSNTLLEAVVRNDVDIGVMFSSLVCFAAWDISLGKYRIIQVGNITEDRYTETILVPPNSAIHDLRDLDGVMIGAFPGIFIKTIIRQLAQENGFVLQDSNYMEIPPAAQLAALQNGQVDALYALEPTVTIATLQGIGIPLIACPPCELLEPMPVGVTVVAAELAETHADITRKVVQVFDEAAQVIVQDEAGARAALVDGLGLSQEVAAQVHIAEYAAVGGTQVAQLQAFADLVLKWGLIDKAVNVSSMVLEP